MLLALILAIISYPCSTNFTEGSSFMPLINNGIAVGYDSTTDTILLLGGCRYPQHFTTFKQHNFNTINQTYLTFEQQTCGLSQHFTQIDDELWIIRSDGEGFIVMNTTSYIVTTPPIAIPISSYGCLTSVSGYLIVVGGKRSNSTSSQIYNMSNDEWLLDVPSLPSPRIFISCVVVNHKLYVIGGYNGSNKVDTILYLDVSNMQQISSESWQTLNGKLATPREHTSAVVYGTDIYVIGGDSTIYSFLNDVNIINTLTGNCMVSADHYLPEGILSSASIIVDNMAYAFGGMSKSGGTWINAYFYETLPTPTPISSPSTTAVNSTLFPTTAVNEQKVQEVTKSMHNGIKSTLHDTDTAQVDTKKILYYIILVPIICCGLCLLLLFIRFNIAICNLFKKRDTYKKTNTKEERIEHERILSMSTVMSTNVLSDVMEDDDHINTDEVNVDKAFVKQWLEFDVELPEYTDIFIENGYNNMDKLKSIRHKSVLTKMGITLGGHRTLIMSELDILREQSNGEKHDSKIDDDEMTEVLINVKSKVSMCKYINEGLDEVGQMSMKAGEISIEFGRNKTDSFNSIKAEPVVVDHEDVDEEIHIVFDDNDNSDSDNRRDNEHVLTPKEATTKYESSSDSSFEDSMPGKLTDIGDMIIAIE